MIGSGCHPLAIHFQREAGGYFGRAVKLRSGDESGRAPLKPPARVLVRAHARGRRQMDSVHLFFPRHDRLDTTATRCPLIQARTAAVPASYLNSALIRVNLPLLILIGDPRSRGSPIRINGGKFTKTIFLS